MITRAFYIGIKQNLKFCGFTFGNFIYAFKKEWHMMRDVMGFSLYVKYMNGIAKEGVDFITVTPNPVE